MTDEPQIYIKAPLCSRCGTCGDSLVPGVIVDWPESSLLHGKFVTASLASKLPGRSTWTDSYGRGSYEHTPERCRARLLRDVDPLYWPDDD